MKVDQYLNELFKKESVSAASGLPGIESIEPIRNIKKDPPSDPKKDLKFIKTEI